MTEILEWIVENKELILTAAGVIVAALKLFSWGKARSDALDVVVNAIEQSMAHGVKIHVAVKSKKQRNAVRTAIRGSIAKVDAKHAE